MMRVDTQAEVFIPRPPEAAFDFAVAETTLPLVLRAAFPIPGVVRIDWEGGGALRVGANRRATMTDGSVMVEEIVTHVRPREHAYRWAGKVPLPLRPVIRGAKGTWTFEPLASGTRVVWRYTFDLTSPLAYLHGRLVALLFRRWMRRGLARLSQLA